LNSGYSGFGCPGVVFLLTEFPLRQQNMSLLIPHFDILLHTIVHTC
jgi:hypothetical protein